VSTQAITDAVARVKAIAASHTEAYIYVDAADLALIVGHEAVKSRHDGHVWGGIADRAQTTKRKLVGIHRDHHLAMLLAAVEPPAPGA
jgi:hypothetical protein